MMTDVMEVAERAKATMADAATEIMRDICNVDPTGKWNRDDSPDRIVITRDALDLILRRHLLGEDV